MRETPHLAGQQAEPRHLALLAFVEQHLQADANAEKRLAAGGSDDRVPQAARIHLAHAVGHRALPRKHHAAGAR